MGPSLSALVSATFMCGQNSNNVCIACHPSCTDCDGEGLCNSCNNGSAQTVANGAVCLCSGTKGSVDSYHYDCRDCDSHCGSCWLASNPNQCLTCTGETGGGNVAPGSCTCEGWTKPSLAGGCCTGCSSCYGPNSNQCLTPEQHDVVTKLAEIGSLPLSSARTDQLMCFRQRQPTITCTSDPVEAVIGAITGDTPASYQCLKLLVSVWPYLTHWFDQLFPSYSDPSSATADDLLTIKSVIFVWILQFGASEMSRDTWDPLKTALGTGGDWTSYLAWAGTDPKFSLDGSVTPLDFPTVLSDWIKNTAGCNQAPAGCMDLLPFNTLSTACDTAVCGHKTQCDLAFATHSCTS